MKMRRRSTIAATICVIAFATSCGRGDTADTSRAAQPPTVCTTAGVKDVVTWFGRQLQNVSLLGPDSILTRQIRESYAPFATQAQLEAWLAAPQSAPGRKASSPWPDRVEIDSVRAGENGSCVVDGRLIYVSSGDAPSSSGAIRENVSIRLSDEGGWKVSRWETKQ
jgi:hypothetical protein